MAYNKNIQNKDINYLGKDFNSFKNNLSEFAKTYFPTINNDYSAGSPGTMFIEIAAYVGDVLSYYMDSQMKENLLPYAKERANVVKLANTLGYRVKPTNASRTNVNLFIIIPATTAGAPDWAYAPTLLENSQVKSEENGILFSTNRNIDFRFSSSLDPTTTTVYKINPVTNLPSYFLLKKGCDVTSGTRKTTTFTIGPVERYKKIELVDTDVIEIESITDSDGKTWSEVPYLAQETVFQEIENSAEMDQSMSQHSNDVPYLLKLKKTSKRFISRTSAENKTEIVFGSGVSISPDELIIPNPENVGNNTSSGVSKLDRSFDPSNFLQTKAYGQAPKNTTLSVKYKVGGGQKSNVSAGTITKIDSTIWMSSGDSLDASVLNIAKQSLAVNNIEAAQGGSSAETIDEIKRNALVYFQSQNRIVTKEDYIGRTYAMPARYGSISKAYVASDTILNQANKKGEKLWDPEKGEYVEAKYHHGWNMNNDKFNLQNPNATNLYLLGYDKNKRLTKVNAATKENLKTYLTPYRMLTDAINIKNGFIVNIGIKFEIIPLSHKNNNEVLIRCMHAIKQYFNIDKWQFNEPINISDFTTTLAMVEGGYSGNRYDLTAATKNNIIYPPVDPSVFELKYPDIDVSGKISSY